MIKLKFLSAVIIAAATLAAPAMARESCRSFGVNANVSITPRVNYIGERDHFRDYEDHDAWGHWGTYYGPMLPSFP
jgi:hypothetical protein